MALQHEAWRYLDAPPRALALVLAVSVVVLGAALLSQYVGGLRPCVLCLYQRVPYALVIGLTGAALLLSAVAGGKRAPLVGGVFAVCAVIFLAGAGIAAFHVGVEQGWWAGTESCTAPDLSAMTPAQVREYLLQAPIVRCDEVAWSLAGISMAGYNMIAALGMGVFATLGALRALGNGSQGELIHG